MNTNSFVSDGIKEKIDITRDRLINSLSSNNGFLNGKTQLISQELDTLILQYYIPILTSFKKG